MGELSLSSSDALGPVDEGSSIEIGNLAALEEDSAIVHSTGGAVGYPASARSPSSSPPEAPPQKKTGFILAVVLFVVVAGAVGAYAAGIFGNKGKAPASLHKRH
jgi:hypothetical protein